MRAITRDMYLIVRSHLAALGYGEEIRWAQNVEPPKHADEFASEAIWVILCSGMKAEIARQIERKIWKAIAHGHPAATVFGHAGKAGAISYIWDNRDLLFAGYLQAEDKLGYLAALPWIGEITKFHLAKNLGVDCAKPDRWLERLAKITGETVDGLCQRLARESGDRIATVDLVLWRACNQAVLIPNGSEIEVTIPGFWATRLP